jgi:mannose-6-phosphate isomerase-like protein (cupin superfamily)
MGSRGRRGQRIQYPPGPIRRSGDPLPFIDTLREAALRSSNGYVEFLRVPSMSAGIYVLGAGAIDRQTPHTEDEIYYVVRGHARFRRGDEELSVRPGELLFVPARQPHRFHSISEELVLLVVFAPAEQPTS